MMLKQQIRIAMQKSGKLASESQTLFQQCGFNLQACANQLLVHDEQFNIAFIFARDDDIPGLIENRVCDFGIIGRNLLAEYCLNNPTSSQQISTIMALGFSKCRLSLAAPKGISYPNPESLAGKLIATSYPNLLRQYLGDNQVNAKIITMHGSVELAPRIGLADLICDLVSSGATLKENGLDELATVMESEAMLVAHQEVLLERKSFIDRLTLRMRGVLKARKTKYVMLHIDRDKLGQLTDILPGDESPTVLELQGYSNKVAVHVVSYEDVFWETLEKLNAIGASSILVLPIEKILS